MSVRNQDWYDLNESRSWPFDDTAGLVDSFGKRLPNDMIADLYLKFPRVYGDRAFVSSFTVSPGIVTLTFLATGVGFTPLASVSLPKPVEKGVLHAIQPLVPGVGGWIVFGSGIDEEEVQSFRFGDSLQSLLLAQTARKYDPLPVQHVGKVFNNPKLTGLVGLRGGTDIETRKEEREIDGVTRDVAVIRLKDKLTGGDTGRNLLELYAGDCGKRPESLNCGDPEPIQYVNTVSPDCCGNIFLEFRGCSDLHAIEGECGVVIDCSFGLSDACVTEDRLPDSEGKLPNEYDDQCPDHTDSSEAASVPEPATGDYAYKTNAGGTAGLPYVETFNDYTADDMTVVAGEFILTDGGNASGGVASITRDGTNNNVVVTFTEAPPSALPQTFTVRDNNVEAYNVEHTLSRVDSTIRLATDITYTSDGSGGTWEETGSSSAGVVWEGQEDRENISVLNQGIFTAAGWSTLWKKAETIVIIKYGAAGARDNGGVIFNYRPSLTVMGEKEFWLAEIDWNDFKTFNILHYNSGVWQIRAMVSVPELDQNKRYRIEVEILPLDEDDDSSTAAYVTARLTGLDDGLSAVAGPVVLPNYYPTNGYFGLYCKQSLTWFESIRIEDFSP